MSKFLILFTILVVGCGGSDGQSPGTGGDDTGTGGVAGTGGEAGEGGSGGTVNTGGTGGAGGEAGAGGTAGVGGEGGSGGDPNVVTVTNADGSNPRECRIAYCGDKLHECGDCLDNDGDDLFDAEEGNAICLNQCDNQESNENLSTNVPGEGGENCTADCYFDVGGGISDNEAAWNYVCDIEVPMQNCSWQDRDYDRICAPFFDEEGIPVAFVPEDNFCEAITPNGCDCFGCCDIFGIEGFVFLGTEDGDFGGNCTLETPEYCGSCTIQQECFNEVGECELGIGMTVDDLPEHCQAELRCPDQEVPLPCGAEGDALCPVNHYCITGCCVEVIVQ